MQESKSSSVDLGYIHLFQQVRHNIVKCCKKIIADNKISQQNISVLSKNFDEMLYLNSLFLGLEESKNRYSAKVLQEFYSQINIIFSADFLPHEKQFLLDVLVRYEGSRNFIGVARFMQHKSCEEHLFYDLLSDPEIIDQFDQFEQDVRKFGNDEKEISANIQSSLRGANKNIQKYTLFDDFSDDKYVYGESIDIVVNKNKYIMGYKLNLSDIYILQNLGFINLSVKLRLENAELRQVTLPINSKLLEGSYLATSIKLPEHSIVPEQEYFQDDVVNLNVLRQLDNLGLKSILVKYDNKVGSLTWHDFGVFNFINSNTSEVVLSNDISLSNASISFFENVSCGKKCVLTFSKNSSVVLKDYLLLKKLKKPVCLVNKHDEYAMFLNGFKSSKKLHVWLMHEVDNWRVKNVRFWSDSANFPTNIVLAKLYLSWKEKNNISKINSLKKWFYFHRLFTKHSIESCVISDVKFSANLQNIQVNCKISSQDFLSTYYKINARISAVNLFIKSLRDSIGAHAVRNASHRGVNSIVHVYNSQDCKQQHERQAYDLGYQMVVAPTPVISTTDAKMFARANLLSSVIYHPYYGATGNFSSLSQDLIEHVFSFVTPKGLMQNFQHRLDQDKKSYLVTSSNRGRVLLQDASLNQYKSRLGSNMLESRFSSQMQARNNLNRFKNHSLPSKNSGFKFFNVMVAAWPVHGKVIEDVLFVLMLAVLLVILTEVPFFVSFLSIAPLFSLFVFTLFDIYHENKHLVENSFLEKVNKKAKVSNDIAPIVQADCLFGALNSFELIDSQQDHPVCEDKKSEFGYRSMYQSQPGLGGSC